MSNEIVIHGYDQKQIQLLINTVAPKLDQNELSLFLYTCKNYGLDPFLKQIYALKIKGRMVAYVGIDGARALAERTQKYAPGKESSFSYKDGKIVSCTSYVKKMTPDGTWHEVGASALFSEYNKGGDTPWKTMPSVMIEKVAEMRALRRAFPAEMGGLYIKEELNGDEENIQVAKEAPIQQECEEVIDITEKPKYVPQISKQDVDLLVSLISEEEKKKTLQFCLDRFENADLSYLPRETYDIVVQKARKKLNAESVCV